MVVPGLPHHITQRGNRRQRTFFRDEDYRTYIELMVQWCGRCGVEVWAYCLMPNHVHLIAVPGTTEGLCRAIGEAHRRYTRYINFRHRWRGYLWQGRFASFAMDEERMLVAARYIEQNPVRAGLAKDAGKYPWSSAKAHILGEDDGLVRVDAIGKLVGDWRSYLRDVVGEKELEELRQHERTGRPLGQEGFVQRLEKKLGRLLRRQRPGPKPRPRAGRARR